MAIIRCQACGKPNPDFLENCQYCEARLKPLTSGPESSDDTLIAPPAEAPQAGDTQDPLARLRSAQTFEADPTEPEPAADEPAEPETADWLSRLAGVGAASDPHGEPVPDWMLTEPVDDTPKVAPSWLRSEPPPPADVPRAAAKAGDEELPDWLSDLANATAAPILPAPVPPSIMEPIPPAEPPAPAEASAEDELPEWLREQLAPKPAGQPSPRKKMTDWLPPTPPAPLAEASPAAEPPAEVPAPSLEPPTPASPETHEASPADQTLVPPSQPRRKKMTDWLTPPEGGLPPQIPTPAPAEPEAELPDWLKAMQPVEEVPDWLREVAAAPRVFNRPMTPPETPAAPEAPALAPAGDEVTPPAPSAPSLELPAAPTLAPTPEADLPDWLKAMRGSATPAQPPTTEQHPLPSARRQQELPAWLKGAAGTPPSEPPKLPPAMPSMPADLAPSLTPEAEAPETALPAEASATPAWLSPEADEPERETAAEEPPAAPGDYELPDWLRPSPEALAEAEAELAAAEQAEDTAAINAAELARAEQELPDWLRNLPTQSAEAEAEAEAAPQPDHQPEPDVPAWLRPAGPPPSPPEPAETMAPGEIPDWLQTLQSPTASPSLPAGSEPSDLPPLDDETLAWLTATATRDDSAQPAEELAAAPPAPWLDEAADLGVASLAALTDDEAEPAAEPTAEADMPDWLRALRGGTPTPEQEAAEAMPEWLRALRGVPPAPVTASSAAEQSASDQASQDDDGEAPGERVLAGEDKGGLPEWLAAMRPTNVEHPADSEVDAYEENVGVLAGMRGVLRAEPTVAQPHRSTTPVQRLVVSENQAAHVKLLAGLLTAEEAAQPVTQQPSRAGALARRLERWFVFLVLAAAILIPQFALPEMFAVPTTISREAQAAFNAVNLAPVNQPALVVFDYDPAQQGELDPGVSAILTHLMSRGVPVVGVSTRPMGAGVAENTLAQAAAEMRTRSGASFTYGTQYLNLGYIPGGPVGLVQFAAAPKSVFQADFSGAGPATALWTQPILRRVENLDDFGLMVLVTATPDDTRAWIEQSQAYAAGIPRLAVVSAGAEPMVLPYAEGEASQLDGLVSGLVGAAQYEQQAGLPGLASRHWSALGGGLWAALLLIAGGNFVYATMAAAQRGLGARRRKP